MFAKKRKFLGRAATGLIAVAGLVNAELKAQIVGSGVMNMSQGQPAATAGQGVPQATGYPRQMGPTPNGGFAPLQGINPQQAAMPHLGGNPQPNANGMISNFQVIQDRAVQTVPQAAPMQTGSPVPGNSNQFLGAPNQAGLPESIDSILASARALEEQGDMDRAGQTYQQALMRNPDNRMLMLSFARMLHRQGDLDRAIAVYQRSLSIHRHDPVAMNDFGLCLARKGDLQQAASLLTAAVAARPDSTRYRNNLATVLIESGRMEEAYMQLAQAYGAPGAYYNLGYLLQRRGRTSEAIHHLQLALRMQPNMQAATELLAKLEATQGTMVADRRAASDLSEPEPQPALRLQSATAEESQPKEVFAQFEEASSAESPTTASMPAKGELRRLAPTDEEEPPMIVDPELLAQVVADQVAESVEDRLGSFTAKDEQKSEETASLISQQVIDALAGKLADNAKSGDVAKEVSTLLAQQVADVVAVKVGEAKANAELSPEVADALAKQVSESVVQRVTDTLTNVQKATDTLVEQVANSAPPADLKEELTAALSESLAEAVAARVAERITASLAAQVQAQHEAAQLATQEVVASLADEVATKAASSVLERAAERAAREGAEKVALEKAAAEKLAAEKLAAEKLAAEKAEAEKLAAEKAAAEKKAKEQAEAEASAEPRDPAAAPEPQPLEIRSGKGTGPFGYTRPYSYYRRDGERSSRESLFDR